MICRSQKTLYYLKSKNRAAAVAGDNSAEATTTTSVTFQIHNAKLYVPVVSLSINDSIKFLKNLKQGFRITVSWNKYRSEITTQPKNNSLDFIIDLTFKSINMLPVLSFKYGDDDPTRNCFGEYSMPLEKIKDFRSLINNKLFFISL